MEIEEPSRAPRDAREPEPEFRFDPLSGRWALIAEGRGRRPSNVETTSRASTEARSRGERDANCPFCPGNESATTATVAAVVRKERGGTDRVDGTRAEDYVVVGSESEVGSAWTSRAVKNKYPVFRDSPTSGREPSFETIQKSFRALDLPASERFVQKIGAIGRHEVIVDSRRHIRGWGEMTELEIRLAFRLIQSRLRVLRAEGRFAHAFFFKNVGANAGASQSHTHCQLVAGEAIPDDVYRQLENMAEYEKKRRSAGETLSYWDAALKEELCDGRRVATATENFVLFCPFASRFPMQSEICPRFDGAFEDYSIERLDEMAILARNAMIALQRARDLFARAAETPFSFVDYNVVMTNAPYVVPSEMVGVERFFRPRLTILPSLVKKAGYEQGSGIDVNPVAPETAARRLGAFFEQSETTSRPSLSR